MGGNIFKNQVKTKRILKEDIEPTLNNFVNDLKIDNFDLNYVMNSLLGSTGKKNNSGDLDIILNTTPKLLYGQHDYPIFDKYHFRNILQELFPDSHLYTTMFKMGIISVAYPKVNQRASIQIDLIFGDKEYMQWSHYSPGDESEFKGVYLSQLYGVLAKYKILFKYPKNSIVDKDKKIDTRICQVNYALDLEKGLKYVYRMYNKNRSSFQKVSPEYFETHCPIIPPRFTRFDYLSNPNDIVRILFDNDIKVEDANTLEKAIELLKYRDDAENIRQAYKDSVYHSSAKFDDKIPLIDKLWE